MNDDVRDFFDRLAEKWDGMVVHPVDRIEAVLDFSGDLSGKKILDVGCGTGVLIKHLLDRAGKRGSVTALDIAPAMIAEAKRKHDSPNLGFRVADFLAWEPPCAFDFVIAYSCYPHFLEPAVFWAALARCLAPGGRVLVAHIESRETINAMHGKRAPGVSRGLDPMAEVTSLASRHGFSALATREADGYFLLLAEYRP